MKQAHTSSSIRVRSGANGLTNDGVKMSTQHKLICFFNMSELTKGYKINNYATDAGGVIVN